MMTTINRGTRERLVSTGERDTWRKEWRHDDGVWRSVPPEDAPAFPPAWREPQEGDGVIVWLAICGLLVLCGFTLWAIWRLV